ncbi:S-layer homology domain-containing protein, partial [Lysinibacillus mangiferihumi]
MANQPKKYKKFVATAATATLVASAIVPVASAAGFSDVAGNDHEVAINALADAGIINGYADGTFKPNQTINRGQVVKLLGRYLEAQGQEIPADWNSKQRFNDLPVTAEAELVKYAALAKDAGVFNGSNGNLNASQTMQRQQMAVVLVRAIKEIAGVDLVAEYKKANFVTEIGDLDKAYSAEQRTAIVALEYAGITNVAHFNPGNSVTRGQFASFLYRTIENVVNNPEAGVAAVKAINSTTVEVTFDEEVDNVQALNFLISDLEVKNAAVKQTNKKVVVLTTAAQTADKEYTVSLGEEKIGTFKGIAAVVPTKVDLVEKSVQGKLGQQVTVKAQVTVAEG